MSRAQRLLAAGWLPIAAAPKCGEWIIATDQDERCAVVRWHDGTWRDHSNEYGLDDADFWHPIPIFGAKRGGSISPHTVNLFYIERIARSMETGRDWHPDHPAYVRWLGQVLIELWAADKALDVAQDAVAEAKRATGNWRVNPLGHGHPAVIAVREAKERRRAALAAIEGDS